MLNRLLGDFVADLELDELPSFPLNPRELDTEFYMWQVASFASEVSRWYQDSYAMATNEFLSMRDSLFLLTADFPQQENDWLHMLELWTRYSQEYGELLELYSANVRNHDLSLHEWFLENTAWHQALYDFQSEILDWHDISYYWFSEGVSWQVEFIEHLHAVAEYYESMAAFHHDLDGNVVAVMNELTLWLNSILDYEQLLQSNFDLFLDATDMYNNQLRLSSSFLDDLIGWHQRLSNHYDILNYWQYDVNYRLTDLNDWQDEFEEHQREMRNAIDLLLFAIYDLPAIPDGLLYDVDLYDYWGLLAMPNPIPSLPALTTPPWGSGVVSVGDTGGELHASLITAMPEPLVLPNFSQHSHSHNSFNLTTTTGPAIVIPGGPGANVGNDLILYSQLLNAWYNQLQYAFHEMLHWHDYLILSYDYIQQSNYEIVQWRDELDDVYADMHEFHGLLELSAYEFAEWRNNLSNFSYTATHWDNQLRTYSDEMFVWHEVLSVSFALFLFRTG